MIGEEIQGRIEVSFVPGSVPHKVEHKIMTGRGRPPNLELRLKDVVATVRIETVIEKKVDRIISLEDCKANPEKLLGERRPNLIEWVQIFIKLIRQTIRDARVVTNIPEETILNALEEIDRVSAEREHHFTVADRTEVNVLSDEEVVSLNVDAETLELIPEEKPADESSEDSK